MRIMQLMVSGWSCEMISAALGLPGTQIAKIARREISRCNKLSLKHAEQIRRLELERLDAYLRALWPAVEKGHHRSIEVALKVSERRARLQGLDEPEKKAIAVSQLTANLTPLELLAEAERLGLPAPGLPRLIHRLPGEEIDEDYPIPPEPADPCTE